MQEHLKLHRSYSSGATIWGSVHPTEENIFLLKNVDMYNYTAVVQGPAEIGTITIFKQIDELCF